jgi:UDP-N-acetylmuramoyl-tripeptide--D-alanyl-D-alanine ligase
MVRDLLIFILKILAKATLWRYRPTVVGLTGSVGKTSSKEAIFAVLKNKFNVRRNQKNYNNELGVPLTILGQETGGQSFFHWLKVIIAGSLGIVYTRNYPEILVLEMGADKIGDIAYLVSFVRCHIGVVTAIGAIPVHVEFFQGAEQVAQEKANLIKSLDKDGWAVLNFDDERVRAMVTKTKAKVFGYGFHPDADLQTSQLEAHLDDLSQAAMNFKVDYRGSNVPLRLPGLSGVHQICPVLTAIAVGLIFKMNLVEISQALKNYQLPAGRLRLLKGIKNSWIIDDTYNASPVATLAALEVLAKTKGRKIAVLGDMLELGSFSEEAHRQVGAKVALGADLLLTVGERSLFIVEQARKGGLAEDKIFHFANSEEAARVLQNLIQAGDIILIKGSQSIRMEKITKEVMAEPERAGELLVRQEKAWLKKRF